MVTHVLLFRLRSNQSAGFMESAVFLGFPCFRSDFIYRVMGKLKAHLLKKISHHRSSRKA
jgi:hypothetical protein